MAARRKIKNYGKQTLCGPLLLILSDPQVLTWLCMTAKRDLCEVLCREEHDQDKSESIFCGREF